MESRSKEVAILNAALASTRARLSYLEESVTTKEGSPLKDNKSSQQDTVTSAVQATMKFAEHEKTAAIKALTLKYERFIQDLRSAKSLETQNIRENIESVGHMSGN